MIFCREATTGGKFSLINMKVAIAQIEPVLGDISANLKLHISRIEKAIELGSQLILFPELSLTGYLLKDMVPEVARKAGSHPTFRKLLELSREITIIVGFVELGQGIQFFNSAACLEEGKILHTHRKVFLPTYGMFDEGRDFAKGEMFRAFPSHLGRLGILVCEDLWHSTSSFLLTQDGAEVLLVPSSSPTKGVDGKETLACLETWLELARVTARFQTVFLLYANRVGFEDGIHYGGGSFIVDPMGEILTRSKTWKEELLVADLSTDILREARTAYPLVRDSRLDLLYRELGRLRKRKFYL